MVDSTFHWQKSFQPGAVGSGDCAWTPMQDMSGSPEDQSAQQEPSNKKPKRFQCHRCQRLFARLEHLQRHERTHTQEKPFACHQCDQRFSRTYVNNQSQIPTTVNCFAIRMFDVLSQVRMCTQIRV